MGEADPGALVSPQTPRDTIGTYEVPAGRGTRVPVLGSIDRR